MEIRNKVIEIIANTLNLPAEKISENTAIGDFEEWDSFRHIQIIAEIEKNFGFKFKTEEMIQLKKVGEIIKATEQKL